MNDPLFDISDGNTPVDEDEADGLLLSWVRTRGDLNEAEAANILDARRAVRSPSLEEVTDDLWLRRLHRLMFGQVWSWAGSYRKSGRNIGMDWQDIAVAVRSLGVDCRTWVSVDATDLSICRFHHRLLAIHPFPNGNGRHARAASEYLCLAVGLPRPSWGANAFDDPVELRGAYLRALRRADRDPEDLAALATFIWSSPS